MAIIRVPRYFTALSIQPVLACIDQVMLDEPQEIICDAREVRFVDPVGLCLLVHAMQDARTHGQTIRLEGLSSELSSYMARMDVFQQGGIHFPENFQRHDQRHVLAEVQPISHSRDVDAVASRLAHAISGNRRRGDNDRDKLVDSLQYLLVETLDNSLTHARKHRHDNSLTYVAAQYYPRNDMVRFAVVDNGCGFLRSLQNHSGLRDRTNATAIRLAVEPYVSCNRDVGLQGFEAHNQGVGLTLCQKLVTAANGRILIGSGNQTVDFRKNSMRTIDHAPWLGSFFAAEVKRARLAEIHRAELFREILPQQTGDDTDLVFVD